MSRPISALLLPAVAGATGFCANLAQVSLFRFFMGMFYGTEMHLGIFLAIWLAGISAGGYFGGRKTPEPGALISWFILTTMLSALFMLGGYQYLPDPQGGFLPFMPVAIFMILCVFPVSFFIGMLLPALLQQSNLSLGLFYSYEAVGAFCAGIFFSFILGGTASPILCLLSLPIIFVSVSILLQPSWLKAAFVVLILTPFIFFKGNELVEKMENNYWKKANSSQQLQQTIETPYQKLQLCSYYEQKSLFSNGMFSCSWPMQANSEQLVHSFVTALKNFNQILVLGAPPPDVINEFGKYEGTALTIVELDARVIELYDYPDTTRSRIRLINDDPRRFLNSTSEKFDGIMIYPVSPVTLSGNRLFTNEAFAAMKKCLKPEGVLSLQVAGSENYLGSIKEQIILSTWQGLGQIFSQRSALPGSSITFFACQAANVLPEGVKDYMTRFKQRKIQTLTFLPISFFNILQPFRVKELEEWLNRPLVARPNTDNHPESFTQQLELWNIYSGSSGNQIMEWLQRRKLTELIVVVVILALILMVFSRFMSPTSAVTSTVTVGVAISGATGLLSEIILILLYQNNYGAAYQMTAFFFGIYMLGLAGGAWFFGRSATTKPAFTRLKWVKFLQILFVVAGVFLLESSVLHGAISIAGAIFLIAFLDGIEFPVADGILRNFGNNSSRSAGLLLFADNAGALSAGLGSGLWLLPTIGMQGCFVLLAAMLLANFAVLLLLPGRLYSSLSSSERV